MRGVTFEPTEDQRRLVRALAGFGITHDDIAKQVGCEPKTLRKHFREELDRGSVEATAKVAQSLFQMATTGKNVAAAIFWMKCRGGWREKPQDDAANAVPPSYVVYTGVPRRQGLTDDETPDDDAEEEHDVDDDEAEEQPTRYGRYVIAVPRELTVEEWIATCGTPDAAETSGEVAPQQRDTAP